MCGETRIGLFSDSSTKGSRKSPWSPIYTALRASSRLGFRLVKSLANCCNFAIDTSVISTSCTTHKRNPTFSIKLSSIFAILDCKSQFLLVLDCLQELDLCGQADLASARSVTSRRLVQRLHWRNVHDTLQSDRQGQTPPKSIHVISSKDRPPLPYQVVSDFRLLGEIYPSCFHSRLFLFIIPTVHEKSQQKK